MAATSKSTSRTRMHTTEHPLDEDTRRSMVVELNHRLADAFDLYTQTKQAHWNVKGMDFYQLHKLFDELAEKVEGHVDLLAERATALGGVAQGTARMAAANSSLPELPADAQTGRALVEALVERYAHHTKKVGEAIETADEAGDAATADLFTEIARDIDGSLYFLEAHLQGPRGA